MKQSPESKYCSKPGIVSRMRSINCPDAGLYFMVTSTEFKLWRVLGPTQNFRGDGTEQRQHLVYITNIVPNKEANIETWKTWCLWSFAWILLPGQTTSFFEFYSSSLSIPPVSGFGQQCQIITLLCCEERGEMNGRQRDREKGTIWCLTRILENTNIDCGTSHISAVHSLEKKQNQTLILTSKVPKKTDFNFAEFES